MRTLLFRNARWAPGLMMALLLLEPTRCGPPPITGQAAEFPPALVITEGKTAQGFPYLFGGISSNEREVMEERAKGYNLKLVFADKSGPFIAGVTVAIADAKGAEIAAIACDGPWLYVQLPPGSYAVKATFKGESKQVKELKVPKDRAVQQTFVWDLGEGRQP